MDVIFVPVVNMQMKDVEKKNRVCIRWIVHLSVVLNTKKKESEYGKAFGSETSEEILLWEKEAFFKRDTLCKSD